ncbi:MAG: DUF4126 domain-containing protein [Sphingomonadales bacterium]|nr:DUF4126 domain-containing protein [Sphingomonadales bacterium]
MLILALVIGIVAGLRTMTAPAAIAWGASAGTLVLAGSPLEFLGWRFTPWVLSVLAAGELITDQLPSTPSRKVSIQFGARLASGALCGAAVGVDQGALLAGLALGVAGAVIGTLGGAAARARLAALFGRDTPAALLEDVVAIGAATLVAYSL